MKLSTEDRPIAAEMRPRPSDLEPVLQRQRVDDAGLERIDGVHADGTTQHLLAQEGRPAGCPLLLIEEEEPRQELSRLRVSEERPQGSERQGIAGRRDLHQRIPEHRRIRRQPLAGRERRAHAHAPEASGAAVVEGEAAFGDAARQNVVDEHAGRHSPRADIQQEVVRRRHECDAPACRVKAVAACGPVDQACEGRDTETVDTGMAFELHDRGQVQPAGDADDGVEVATGDQDAVRVFVDAGHRSVRGGTHASDIQPVPNVVSAGEAGRVADAAGEEERPVFDVPGGAVEHGLPRPASPHQGVGGQAAFAVAGPAVPAGPAAGVGCADLGELVSAQAVQATLEHPAAGVVRAQVVADRGAPSLQMVVARRDERAALAQPCLDRVRERPVSTAHVVAGRLEESAGCNPVGMPQPSTCERPPAPEQRRLGARRVPAGGRLEAVGERERSPPVAVPANRQEAARERVREVGPDEHPLHQSGLEGRSGVGIQTLGLGPPRRGVEREPRQREDERESWRQLASGHAPQVSRQPAVVPTEARMGSPSLTGARAGRGASSSIVTHPPAPGARESNRS